MAIEKNPFEKINNDVKEVGENLGVDVSVKPEQEEDLAVDVDTNTGEVSLALNEDSGKVLASIKDFYGNLADYIDEEDLEDLGGTIIDNFNSDKDSRG